MNVPAPVRARRALDADEAASGQQFNAARYQGSRTIERLPPVEDWRYGLLSLGRA